MSENNNSLSENRNLRLATIASVISLVIAPIVAIMMGLEWSVVVMVVIAVVAFFVVLFVMIIGSTHADYPSAASDSASVTAWSERLAASEQAQAEATVKEIEDASGPSDD